MGTTKATTRLSWWKAAFYLFAVAVILYGSYGNVSAARIWELATILLIAMAVHLLSRSLDGRALAKESPNGHALLKGLGLAAIAFTLFAAVSVLAGFPPPVMIVR